jgi:predicted ribonuclease YlaK
MVKKKKRGAKKIFVLDTSVIIFDPNCFYCFQDNDVVIPNARASAG